MILEPGDPINSATVELTPVQGLQRNSLAGFIDVKTIAPPDADRFPPARVIDLTIVETIYSNRSTTLTWTAVGDDIDEGRGTTIIKINCVNCYQCKNPMKTVFI